MRKITLLLVAPMMLIALSFSILPSTATPVANAQSASIKAGLSTAAGGNVTQQDSLLPMIGNLIQVAIGITGILLVLMLIYAGFLYITALGDSGKVDKAKKLIVYSITGILLIVASYAISNFVIDALAGTVTGGPAISGGTPTDPSI